MPEKYRFLPLNNFFNKFSKIKNLEKRAAANNRNKCERFRKQWYRTENKVPQDLMETNKKSTLYEPREEGRVG